MTTAQEAFSISNQGAGTYPFTLKIGGLYQFAVVATFGGGSVKIENLGPDGSTWLSVSSAIVANGGETDNLPPGAYRFNVATATAVYARVARIPQ